MKTILLITALFVSTLVFAQSGFQLKAGAKLPGSLQLKDEIQKFEVTTDHFNTDIFSHFMSKFRVQGEYTRGLGGGRVKWNNVTVAMSMAETGDFPKGNPVGYMENYTYVPGADMMNADKFTTFTEYAPYTKNLIWDMMGIEGFAWAYFDKLELNVPFSAESINGKIELAGEGFFENKNILLTWTGISEMNGETCALIDYRTFRNPLEVTAEGMDMKGRSHYWGTIWVSLIDKQIEHAVLYEDVILEMQLPGQSQKQVLNAMREITYKKVL